MNDQLNKDSVNLVEPDLVLPELRPLLEAFPEIQLACKDDLAGMRQFRTGAADMLGTQNLPPDGVERVEVNIPGKEGCADIRVLVHRPVGISGPLPVLMYIHGGGMVAGFPELCNQRMGVLAKHHGCAVVAPDYIKAPEGPWPQGVYDCFTVLEWLESDAAIDTGIEPTSIVVFGESGGGGIAAGLAIYARNKGNCLIEGLALSAPMLDDRTGSHPPPAPHYGQHVWTPMNNATAWSLVCTEQKKDEDCPIPARAEDLSGLPPTMAYVGQLDLFFHETLKWVEKLADAGVSVELHVFPGAYHGFEMTSDTPTAKRAFDELDRFYERFFSRGDDS